MDWYIVDTLFCARGGCPYRIEDNRRYTIRYTSGASVGVLWHLSAAATIDVEEARLYSNGELNGVSSSNTFMHSVLIYLQGDLWIYALLMNLLCLPLFFDYEGLWTKALILYCRIYSLLCL